MRVLLILTLFLNNGKGVESIAKFELPAGDFLFVSAIDLLDPLVNVADRIF